MSRRADQRGFLMVGVVILIVVVAFLVVSLSSMLSSNVHTTVNNLGSMQALYEAESGLEYGQRQLAVDLDWYRSTVDPVVYPTQTLADGNFATTVTLPATMLRTRIPTAGSTAALNVFTTGRFPDAGFLQIEDDISASGAGEYVQYVSKTATTFVLAGAGRNVTIGGVVSASGAQPHERASRVYPVTQLRTALPNNCTALASINLDANTKFLGAGTLDIEGEEFLYRGSSTSGGTMTLTSVLRCQNGTLSASHGIGVPVTPILWDNSGVDFEAEVFSTGTQGNAQRFSRRSVQR